MGNLFSYTPEEIENPGITLKDTLEFVNELASKDIDYLHVSLGNFKATSSRDKTDKELIVKKLQSVINYRVPLIGVGHLESLNDLEEAFGLGYDLLALGLISLSDVNVVENLEKNFNKEKIFFKERGNHYEYFWNFFLEAYYYMQLDGNQVKIYEYFYKLFDFKYKKSRSELDMLTEIYKLLEQNLKK